jgi:hypothetical protein
VETIFSPSWNHVFGPRLDGTKKRMRPVTEQRAYFGRPDWLVSYRKDWLRPDIIAGLTPPRWLSLNQYQYRL